MTSLIGVGDNTVDTYIHQGMRYPGGNAVNVAVLAHRYGHPAAYIGVFGTDANGELLRSSLQAEGVDISHCQTIDGPNSYSTVNLVDGDRVFGKADHGVANQITLNDSDLEFIRGFDVVHSSVYSHLEDQIERLKSASRTLSFDFSNERSPDYLAQILPHIDVALLSCADLPLHEQTALMEQLHHQGPQLVLVTRGGEGAWIFDGHTMIHQGVLPILAIDTLGAGDAFAARFLVEAIGGTPLPQAMELAAHSAAENCTIFGAFGYGNPIV